MRKHEPDPDEVNERIKDEEEIDLVIAATTTPRPVNRSTMPLRYCRHCGADMMGSNTCPERCTAGEETPLRYADELPERDFYEGDSPDY